MINRKKVSEYDQSQIADNPVAPLTFVLLYY